MNIKITTIKVANGDRSIILRRGDKITPIFIKNKDYKFEDLGKVLERGLELVYENSNNVIKQ